MARIAAYPGKISPPVKGWMVTQIRPGRHRAEAYYGNDWEKKNGEWGWLTRFWSNFRDPAKVVGTTHILTLHFSNIDALYFAATPFGRTIHFPRPKLKPITNVNEMHVGIGTRTYNDSSWVVADFDNVYVYK